VAPLCFSHRRFANRMKCRVTALLFHRRRRTVSFPAPRCAPATSRRWVSCRS